MKTALYKILLALILVPALACANDGYKGRYTKQKKINREFTVTANDLLKINNSYGNIDIITWDRNRIEIEVIITTNGNDEEKVIERLKNIDVQFNQSGGEVSAKTLFENSNRSFWSNIFGSSSNVNMEVNYRIKAPVTNNMNLSNDYGSINLDKLTGNATISCDYGKIMIGELLGSNNNLNFDYTRNSTIHYVKKARINADYSEFTIDEAGTLDISADYTDSNILKVENISFNNDYGSLKIDKLRNIKGQGDYLGVRLGLVYGSADLNLDYGSAHIQKIMPGLKSLNIDSDYTSLKIGYDREGPFSFDINTSYGNIKGMDGNGFTINKRNQSGSDNKYQGHYLSGNSGGMVKINSSFGSVTFTH